MVTRRVCLHLGTHKTATSLVQRYLGQASHPGREEGIRHVPRRDTACLIGWGPAVVARPYALTLAIAREAARRDAEVVLVSHENALGRPFGKEPGLYARAEPTLQALAIAVADYEVRLVLTLRPQGDFVESYYLQRVKEGLSRSFQDWFADIDQAQLSYRPLVSALRRSFPAAPLRLVDFRELARGQPAYLDYFFRAVLPEHALDTRYEVRHNPGLSMEGLRRALAENARVSDPSERRRTQEALQRTLSHVEGPRAVLLTAKQRRYLELRYARENQKLFADYPAC
jgi:hypothetical protein